MSVIESNVNSYCNIFDSIRESRYFFWCSLCFTPLPYSRTCWAFRLAVRHKLGIRGTSLHCQMSGCGFLWLPMDSESFLLVSLYAYILYTCSILFIGISVHPQNLHDGTGRRGHASWSATWSATWSASYNYWETAEFANVNTMLPSLDFARLLQQLQRNNNYRQPVKTSMLLCLLCNIAYFYG